jgi:superfamily II DNA/RNA helicase
LDTPDFSFDALALPEALKSALTALKFEKPTPIQAQSIPVALSGRDLIGCAQTGTGKTAAFGIPLVAKLLNAPKGTRPRALILTPTRELAEQVAKSIRGLTSTSQQIVTTVLIGGVPMFPQIRSLQKKPQIIVATPGRLMDHLERGSTNLEDVAYFVLDEADRMLDMGFTPQIDRIVHVLPEERQGLLFSATLPPDILKIAARYLKNPERVTAGAVSRPAENVTQKVVRVRGDEKDAALMTELRAREGTVIVFARTKIRTEQVAEFLMKEGWGATLIHGGRSQGQRYRALDGFRQGRYRILVATDVAARMR